MKAEKDITIGEQIVRTSFNPDNSGLVDQLKQSAAVALNLIDEFYSGRNLGQDVKHTIDQLKVDISTLINPNDYINPAECDRLKLLAIGYYDKCISDSYSNKSMEYAEIAAMFAVKAATCQMR